MDDNGFERELEASTVLIRPRGPLDWLEDFALTDEEADELVDPEWAYKNLVIAGHITTICAPANAGKTQVLLYVAGRMAADGYRVVYVNMDANPGDAKRQREYARRHGFEMSFPDIKRGATVDAVMAHLERMAEDRADLADVVFIFDTLKKFVNVIHKVALRDFLKLLRRLSGCGATVVSAAHTNKYKDAEGNLIFEGTVDLRTDGDNLIYLHHQKQDDGAVLVSTKPDKVRGTFEPLTFRVVRVVPDLVVEPVGFVDVADRESKRQQHVADWEEIQVVRALLKARPMARKQLIQACGHKDNVPRLGWRRATKIIDRYKREDAFVQHWEETKRFANNEMQYSLVEGVE